MIEPKRYSVSSFGSVFPDETGFMCRWEDVAKLQAEYKKLTQYKLYVEARISTSEVPMTCKVWDAAVDELAADLEEAVAEQAKEKQE